MQKITLNKEILSKVKKILIIGGTGFWDTT